MNIERPAITQISSIADILKEDELINKQLQTEDAFELLYNKITLRQYKYFLFLIFGKQRSKLIRILANQLGFKKV